MMRPIAIRVLMVAALVAAVVAARGGLKAWTFLVDRDAAERLYRARAWQKADVAVGALMHRAVTERRESAIPALAYNSGNVAYRLGHFQEAERRYRGGLTGSVEVQERSQYNMGNGYLWQARGEYDRAAKRSALRAAVESYEEALILAPHDMDAKWNLEIALRRLADAEELPSALFRRGAANWGGGNLTKSGYEGAPQVGAGASPGGGYGNAGGNEAVPQVTETQARQLLKAIERPQVAGQDMPNGPIRKSQQPSHGKDW
jgi:hypothetical protein